MREFELKIPSTYPNDTKIGVWKGSLMDKLGKHNELLLGETQGRTSIKIKLEDGQNDEVVIRLRRKGIKPFQMTSTVLATGGKISIMNPVIDGIVTGVNDKVLVVIDGKLVWKVGLID